MKDECKFSAPAHAEYAKLFLDIDPRVKLLDPVKFARRSG